MLAMAQIKGAAKGVWVFAETYLVNSLPRNIKDPETRTFENYHYISQVILMKCHDPYLIEQLRKISYAYPYIANKIKTSTKGKTKLKYQRALAKMSFNFTPQ